MPKISSLPIVGVKLLSISSWCKTQIYFHSSGHFVRKTSEGVDGDKGDVDEDIDAEADIDGDDTDEDPEVDVEQKNSAIVAPVF